MVSVPRYVAAETEDALERERLGLLSLLLDPITIRRLEALGLREGWCCLEVGAGNGSVARWMAGRVGPSGRVVATDLDPRFLREPGLPGVEVRSHDISADGLEAGRYDLVHCRLLLMHLRDPEDALARMVAALKPGGLLLAEEGDYGLFGAADPKHPAAERFDAMTHAIFETLKSAGLVDPYLGRRVGHLLERSGLAEVESEGVTWLNRGADPGARQTRMHFDLARKALAAEGVLTGEEWSDLAGICDDPSFRIADMISYGARGRRAE